MAVSTSEKGIEILVYNELNYEGILFYNYLNSEFICIFLWYRVSEQLDGWSAHAWL